MFFITLGEVEASERGEGIAHCLTLLIDLTLACFTRTVAF